jgi:hypothetical protein
MLSKDSVYFILLICVTLIINSCECVVKICAAPFSCKLVDKVGHIDLLSGSNPRYNKDSVYLMFASGYRISSYDGAKIYCDMISPLDTLFLRVSSTDLDTLVMSYNYVKSKCCYDAKGFAQLKSIQFNGRIAPLEGGNFLLEK